MTSREKVYQAAVKLVAESPQGVRWSILHKVIQQLHPDIRANTVHGSLHFFRTHLPKEIYIASRGLYKHVQFKDTNEQPPITPSKKPEDYAEDEFYEQFADWLVNEVEECTHAIPLGGNKFKDKWGTPDVIGIWESKKGDIVQVPMEVTSAEIKTDNQALIIAFGQACAYKLFSHKSYIVVPEDSSEEDIARLDSLARICGIGLILFDKTSKTPEFKIRVRALRHEPDLFYTNKNLEMIKKEFFP